MNLRGPSISAFLQQAEAVQAVAIAEKFSEKTGDLSLENWILLIYCFFLKKYT